MFRFDIAQATVPSLLFVVLSVLAPDASAFSVYKVDLSCVDHGAYPTIQSAIDAAAANPGADYVWIANTSAYSGEHIVIADPDGVIVEGGFADCDDFDPGTDSTLVSGAGNGGLPVFNIVGPSNVSLSNLSIAFASSADGAGGGGIAFTGDGSVTLARTTVFLNSAGYGAGISVVASGGHAELVLHDDVVVTNNAAAHSGGGIRLEGDARLIVVGTGTSIVNNSAVDYGGGIEILGPARADIGAVGGGGGPAINHNSAGNGGGVAVLDNGNGEAVLRTFAYDSTHPTTFNQNTADVDGGAIYLAGLADACLYSPRLTANVASDGAAIFYTPYVADGSGDYTTDGGVYINADFPPDRLGFECGPEPIANLGGTRTCVSPACNTVAQHATKNPDQTPSSGAVIRTDRNELTARRVRLVNNVAGRVINSYGTTINLSRCLVAENSASTELIRIPAVTVEVYSCTFANNSSGGGYVLNVEDSDTVTLAYDIFDQPGQATYTYIILNHFNASYVMAADAAGLPIGANPSVVQGRPKFVDPANGDYHLAPVVQKALDFAPTASSFPDLDGTPFFVDLSAVPNTFGWADLGAYERPYFCGPDTIFCNGFDY